MPAFYSVLQYVPRPLADERINFGVVCFSDADVRVRVLSNWSRVERFFQTDVRFLKDFASRLHEATRQVEAAPGAPLPAEWTRTDLERMAQSLSHSIQLTTPKASLLSPDALLDSVYEDFVLEPSRRVSGARGRRDAKYELSTIVRGALEQRLVEKRAVRGLLHRSRLDGKAEEHPFDAIVGNGAPVFVAHALSFESDATVPSEDHLRSLAFRIEDVKKLQPKLPFGIFSLPPSEDVEVQHAQERFARARIILTSVDAQVIPESEFSEWVAPLADIAASHADVA